jgi:hypothetical protein
MEADLQMNLLAEHGPQDLNQAWMYFKHWVKGRPVHAKEGKGVQAVNLSPVEGEEPAMDWDGSQLLPGRPSKGIDRRSAFGWQPPSGDGPPGSFGQSVHPELKGRVSYDPKFSQDNRDQLNEPRPGVKVMSVAQRYLDERTGELINAVETQGVANSALQRDSLAVQESLNARALLSMRQNVLNRQSADGQIEALAGRIDSLTRSLSDALNGGGSQSGDVGYRLSTYGDYSASASSIGQQASPSTPLASAPIPPFVVETPPVEVQAYLNTAAGTSLPETPATRARWPRPSSNGQFTPRVTFSET